MSDKIYFYQNNPCVIIRDINEEFAEIRLSHYFASDMELTGQCEGCCVGDNDNKLSCTCDDHSWIIEEIQSEENLLLVIAEKRLLTDIPVEHVDILALVKERKRWQERLLKTKELHEEWRLALNAKQAKAESLTHEMESLKLTVDANKHLREQSEAGLEALTNQYNKIAVAIGYGSQKITTGEYDQLLKRGEILTALEAGGVDNWEWYDESLKGIDK